MKYCKRCLYPENHPFGITFDEEGVCSGCRVHEEKDTLDWGQREKKLSSILSAFKNKNSLNYDCIVPVSGAADSYFIVHTIKNVYGLNPLLVCYNKHYNTAIGIRNLSYLRVRFGCDLMVQTIEEDIVKRINLSTLERAGSMYWHCIAGETVFPVQVAVKFKIPLIIWGLHQGCDQVGMFSHTDEVEMTRKYRKEHDLMGVEAEDLIGSQGLKEKELLSYIYPHDKEIETVGVRGIYLNNYIRWDSKTQHEDMIDRYGYKTRFQQRTFNTYQHIDSFHYAGLHDHIKFLKLGYGKVTDHATQEIRFGRMSREDGIKRVNHFSGVIPADIGTFIKWQHISERELFEYVDKHRNRKAWEKSNKGWELRYPVIPQDKSFETASLKRKGESNFLVTEYAENIADESGYTLLTRGYVDHLKQ